MEKEKRLIDANALITQIQGTASKVAANAPYEPEWFTRLAARQFEIIDIIKHRPTVDAEEVVRCEKCNYYDEDGEYCKLWCGVRHPEHFCGEGERRTDNGC